MDTSNHKSVAIDIQTYKTIAEMADRECRSISMQIKWLVKNLQPEVTRKVKVKRKSGLPRIVTVGASADMLVRFNETRASMCGRDFIDLNVEDPSKLLYALCTRGDLNRVGNTSPYYYQITHQGIERSEQILKAREMRNGS